MGKEIFTTRDTGGQFSGDTGISPPETTHPVPEFSIQFGPVDREVSDLIPSVAKIPGFREQLDGSNISFPLIFLIFGAFSGLGAVGVF